MLPLYGAISPITPNIAYPVKFYDQFTDSDATNIISHAPQPVNRLAAAWQQLNGNAQINSNRLLCGAGITRMKLSVPIPSQSCDIFATLRFLVSTKGSPSILLRYVDTNNFLSVCQLSVGAPGAEFRVLKVISGITTVLNSLSFSLSINTLYSMHVQQRGNVFTTTVNSVSMVTTIPDLSTQSNVFAFSSAVATDPDSLAWDDLLIQI